MEVLLTSNNEFTISIRRLKCHHVEVAEVEVVEEEVEVMRLHEIREEDVVEEADLSGDLEDKDPKQSI
jgi:stress response protein YsnF